MKLIYFHAVKSIAVLERNQWLSMIMTTE